ncbi:MAG TPA: four helix bundle protein [Tepidisphaeraceae bacterium]|nr:four helix bundle protein [Tepidisphaeraceae bacterium]
MVPVMVKGFEELDIYRLAEELADAIWKLIIDWERFARDQVGGQLVRAADSIGANLAEGRGHGSYKDNCYFARISRSSFYETRHFLRRAYRRRLLNDEQIAQLQPIVQELGPRLNAYIKVLKRKIAQRSETASNK